MFRINRIHLVNPEKSCSSCEANRKKLTAGQIKAGADNECQRPLFVDDRFDYFWITRLLPSPIAVVGSAASLAPN